MRQEVHKQCSKKKTHTHTHTHTHIYTKRNGLNLGGRGSPGEGRVLEEDLRGGRRREGKTPFHRFTKLKSVGCFQPVFAVGELYPFVKISLAD